MDLFILNFCCTIHTFQKSTNQFQVICIRSRVQFSMQGHILSGVFHMFSGFKLKHLTFVV